MTIFALSTGPGISGVAVIRISGEKTSSIIKLLTGKKLPEPRVATLRKINKINTSELIDEGLVLWFPGPESYTGEDMAEIQVHGSKAVIDAIHSSISTIENFRLAEPGEFTKLAFQNGKINLLKAESIADLISSETEIQRQQAIKIMSGASSEKFNSWREGLLKILSNAFSNAFNCTCVISAIVLFLCYFPKSGSNCTLFSVNSRSLLTKCWPSISSLLCP